jgi:hypothetical protein
LNAQENPGLIGHQTIPFPRRAYILGRNAPDQGGMDLPQRNHSQDLLTPGGRIDK